MSPRPPVPRRRVMLTLARVRGVPVEVAPSWLLIGILLTAIYGPIVRQVVPGVGQATAYVAAFAFAVLFALCIVAHELGHTLVCLALGYPVRRVVLFLLGGVSEMDTEPTRARHELLIAASGPAVSLVLAGVAFGGFAATPVNSLAEALFALLAWSNVILAAFNLLPGLPLDGGRILRAVVWGFGAAPLTGTRVAAWTGRVFALGVAATGLVLDRGRDGIPEAALSLALAGYLWISASASLRSARLLGGLDDMDVSTLLRPGVLVPADLSIAEALRQVWASDARGLVVVDGDGRPSAIVDERAIGAVPPERRPWTSVVEVARSLEPDLTFPADIRPQDLLAQMQRTPAREYLALQPDGSPAGIVTAVDFVDRLRHTTTAARAAGARGSR